MKPLSLPMKFWPDQQIEPIVGTRSEGKGGPNFFRLRLAYDNSRSSALALVKSYGLDHYLHNSPGPCFGNSNLPLFRAPR